MDHNTEKVIYEQELKWDELLINRVHNKRSSDGISGGGVVWLHVASGYSLVRVVGKDMDIEKLSRVPVDEND